MVPYALIVAAFAFVYAFLPNTRVRLGSALVGALVAGVLWQSASWGFARFVVSSGQYTAIYSGFAVVLLFMLWLYVAWLVLLAGSSVAFYYQHPEYLREDGGEGEPGPRAREELALALMALVARAQYPPEIPTTTEALGRALGLPIAPVQATLEALEAAGLLAQTGDPAGRWLLTRALEAIPLASVLDAARGAAGLGAQLPAGPLQGVLTDLQGALHQALAGRTARDLVARRDPGGGGG
jgi:membrane protein